MDRTEYSRRSVCECPAAILVPFRSSCNFLFRPEPILFGSGPLEIPELARTRRRGRQFVVGTQTQGTEIFSKTFVVTSWCLAVLAFRGLSI